jgi:hypothetical protein
MRRSNPSTGLAGECAHRDLCRNQETPPGGSQPGRKTGLGSASLASGPEEHALGSWITHSVFESSLQN